MDISWIVGDSKLFFKYFWSKKYYRWTYRADIDVDFFISDMENVLSNGNIFFPQLTCLDETGHINPLRYICGEASLANPAIHVPRMWKLFAQGATVRVRGLDKFSVTIKRFRKKLIDIFGCNVTINSYLSDKKSGGINPHYDYHHIFIMQLAGVKKWIFGKKSDITPRFNYDPDHDPKYFNPVESIYLQAGEMMYIPPGLWHRTNTEEKSLHLVFEVEVPDWTDYFNGLVEHVMQKNPVMRSAIPFNIKNNRFVYDPHSTQDIKDIFEILVKSSKEFYLSTSVDDNRYTGAVQ